jgi:hypothetical protein
MSPRYAWEGQLGWGEETTLGVAATINRFSEFASESLKYSRARLYVPQIRLTRDRHVERVRQGRAGVAGDVRFQFWYKGLGLWLKHGVGSVVTTGSGPYTHTFTPSDALPVGLTVEPKKGGFFHKYLGCRVDQFSFESEADGYLNMLFGLLGLDEVAPSGSGAAPTFPSSNALAVFTDGVFKIDTVEVGVSSCRGQVMNHLNDSDYRISTGSHLRKTLDPRMHREVTGQFSLPYEAVTEYNKFRNMTVSALNLKYTGGADSLEINFPAVIYDGDTPGVGGPEDEVPLAIPFRALKSGANPMFTIILINGESAL